MTRQERLADALTGAVALICALFYAFAAGVWYDEHKAEPERQQPRPVTVTVHREPVAESPLPDDGEFTGPDPMVEGTYLMEDHLLSYDLQAKLYSACQEFGVDYELALAVIEQETGFRNLVGDGGDSVGYMQIQRRWWSELMADIGAEDLTDPEDNFRTGCAILRELLDKYENTEDALTAYNSGRPGSSSYSRSVMEKMEAYYG